MKHHHFFLFQIEQTLIRLPNIIPIERRPTSSLVGGRSLRTRFLNLSGLKRLKVAYIFPLILLGLFVLSYFSEISPINHFENYSPIGERDTASFVPNSSDIDFVITISSLNPSAQEVEYSFYIHAWLDINTTEIGFLLRTFYTTEFLVMKNLGTASYNSTAGKAWGHYYQIETTKEIRESVSGYPQKYPYDYYSLSFSLTFSTQGLTPTFNQSFQPTVFIPFISGWKTETYSRSINVTNSSVTLDIGVVIHRETLIAVLQFMIPTAAIYFLMGCSLFTSSSDKLKDRISICLTAGVLTLSLYTFLLKQFEWMPLYVQNLAISLVVSNIAMLAFSIIGSSSEDTRSTNVCDGFALVLASIVPILYLSLGALSSMSRLFHVIIADPFWIAREFLPAYIDYRFLLWLIIFQISLWAVYLCKKRVFHYAALATGFGILLVNYLRSGIFQDVTFTIIAVTMICSSPILFFILRKVCPKKLDYCV